MADEQNAEVIIIVLDEDEGDKEEEGRFHQLVEQRCAICNVAWFSSDEASIAKDFSDSVVQLKKNLLDTLRQAYGFQKTQLDCNSNGTVQICSTCSVLTASLHSLDCQLKEFKRMYENAKSKIDCAVIKSINEDHVGEIYGESFTAQLEYGDKSLRRLIYQDWLKRYGRKNNCEPQRDLSTLRTALRISRVKLDAVNSTVEHASNNGNASCTLLNGYQAKRSSGLRNWGINENVTMVLVDSDNNEWTHSAYDGATDEQLPTEELPNCTGVAHSYTSRDEKFVSGDSGDLSQGEPEVQPNGSGEVQGNAVTDIANYEKKRSARSSNETSPDPIPVEGAHEGGNANGSVIYTCQICLKTYKQKNYFRYHMRTHTDSAPRCTICEKVFPTSSRVKRHMKVHTGREGSFKCDTCGKSYHTRKGLSSHRRAHSSQTSFVST